MRYSNGVCVCVCFFTLILSALSFASATEACAAIISIRLMLHKQHLFFIALHKPAGQPASKTITSTEMPVPISHS